MKCMAVTYDLELERYSYNGKESEVRFRKISIMPGIKVMFDEDIYVLDCGNNEHMEFCKELHDIRENSLRKVISEETLRCIELSIVDLIDKYKHTNCVIGNKSSFLLRDRAYLQLSRESFFENFENIGRM